MFRTLGAGRTAIYPCAVPKAQRAVIRKPRVTPWVPFIEMSGALKGRENIL